jgi:DNA replication protein
MFIRIGGNSMNEIVYNTLKKKDYIVKNFLLKIIKDMDLSLNEAILIIYFMNQETPVLDIDNIKEEAYLSEEEIMEAYEKLVTIGILETKVINQNGIREEIISLDNIIKSVSQDITKEGKAKLTVDLFQKFEEEFGRPLSPMEYEIINNWLDNGTSEELILEALKEAIYNNVKSLRYIEKILLNWKDKGYKNKSDVSNGLIQESNDNVLTDLYDFNWLDNE